MTLGEWCKQIPPPVASYSSRKLAAECTECYSDESMMGPKGATPERCRCIPLDSLQGFPTRIHSNSCFQWDRWDHFPYTIHTVYFSLTCFFHSCFIIIITDLLIHFAGVFLPLRTSTKEYKPILALVVAYVHHAVCCGMSEFLATGQHNSSDNAPEQCKGKLFKN